ncbi:hypothetical protein FX985_06443 [Pseudomonas extremaustralis]|uniref:Uncharacterized protein n=1 Tax=Pseudomonas extremaustralis TaxID=359110 RepID=A0A5M9IKN1_9PSED|nr:hypothetical protein FX985_06443 [Pseudomonas extremaustralis]
MLAIQALQVFKEYPPGHAVHHQVVHHQQQALGAIGQLGEYRAQQRAMLQVQATLGPFAEGQEFAGILYALVPQQARARCVMARDPAIGLLAETQAQHIVMPGDGLQGCRQPLGL